MAKIPIEITSDSADAQRDLDRLEKGLSGIEQAGQEAQSGLDDVGDSADKASDGFKVAGLSITDLKSAMDLAGQALSTVGDIYDATIGSVLAYSDQVRDLARISGASADETSRLIQASDDLQVGYDTLTAAAKALAKDGIALTTEELAKASDEYLKIESAGARAEYATTKFGRAGLELTKVLETGGAALREMAAATGESMVLTEEQTKAARDLEIALDGAEDSLQGVAYTVGNVLIPEFTKAMTSINNLIGNLDRLLTWEQKMLPILQQHAKEVIKSGASWEQYSKEMLRAKTVSDQSAAGQAKLAQQLRETGGDLDKLMALWGLYDKAAFGAAQRTGFMAVKAENYTAAQNDMSKASKEVFAALSNTNLSLEDQERDLAAAAIATGAYVKSIDTAAGAMNTLSLSMNLKSSMDAFKKQQDDLKQKIGATNLEIGKLTSLKVLKPEEILKVDQFWRALQLAEKAAKDLGTSGEGSRAGIDAMNAALQKIIPGLPAFTSAKDAVARLRDEVNKLSQGTYRTPEQEKQLSDLKGQLNDLEKAERDLATAQEDATKKMIFNMLLQKAASDGLTKAEVDNLIRVAEKWGLVDEKSAETARKLNEIDLSSVTGELTEFDDVLARIMGRPTSKTVTVTTRFVKIGDDIDDPGAPVPGEPGWGSGGGNGTVRAQSERMGAPTRQSAASGITNNYTININGWQGDAASLALQIERRAEVARIMGG